MHTLILDKVCVYALYLYIYLYIFITMKIVVTCNNELDEHLFDLFGSNILLIYSMDLLKSHK